MSTIPGLRICLSLNDSKDAVFTVPTLELFLVYSQKILLEAQCPVAGVGLCTFGNCEASSFVCVLRHGLAVWCRLAWTSLCNPDWPQDSRSSSCLSLLSATTPDRRPKFWLSIRMLQIHAIQNTPSREFSPIEVNAIFFKYFSLTLIFCKGITNLVRESRE